MNLTPTQHRDFRKIAVPIARLMASPNGLNPMFERAFKDADVIIGLDTDRINDPSLCATLFYGYEFLQGYLDDPDPKPSIPAKMAVVSYRQSTNELEKLIACCEVHRGHCDYQLSTGKGDILPDIVDGSTRKAPSLPPAATMYVLRGNRKAHNSLACWQNSDGSGRGPLVFRSMQEANTTCAKMKADKAGYSVSSINHSELETICKANNWRTLWRDHTQSNGKTVLIGYSMGI